MQTNYVFEKCVRKFFFRYGAPIPPNGTASPSTGKKRVGRDEEEIRKRKRRCALNLVSFRATFFPAPAFSTLPIGRGSERKSDASQSDSSVSRRQERAKKNAFCACRGRRVVAATAAGIASSAEWPDDKLKSSPNYSKSCPKSSHNSLTLKMLLFTLAQKFTMHLGFFWWKPCHQELSKSHNLVTLMSHELLPSLTVLSSNKDETKATIILSSSSCLIHETQVRRRTRRPRNYAEKEVNDTFCVTLNEVDDDNDGDAQSWSAEWIRK